MSAVPIPVRGEGWWIDSSGAKYGPAEQAIGFARVIAPDLAFSLATDHDSTGGYDVKPGAVVTFWLTVENTGAEDAQQVEWAMAFDPAAWTVDAASIHFQASEPPGDCGFEDGEVKLALGNLAPGGLVTLEWTARVV